MLEILLVSCYRNKTLNDNNIYNPGLTVVTVRPACIQPATTPGYSMQLGSMIPTVLISGNPKWLLLYWHVE